MEDFQQWTNENDLVHLPLRGAAFTWNNGRSGYMYTKKRLDRCICNQSWIDMCWLTLTSWIDVLVNLLLFSQVYPCWKTL